METQIQMLVLIPNPTLGEHLEHYDITTGTWKECKSTKDSPCPFDHAPHKMAYGGIFCSCGKTMEQVMEGMKEMVKNTEEEK